VKPWRERDISRLELSIVDDDESSVPLTIFDDCNTIKLFYDDDDDIN
jgi:hypothetical protein